MNRWTISFFVLPIILLLTLLAFDPDSSLESNVLYSTQNNEPTPTPHYILDDSKTLHACKDDALTQELVCAYGNMRVYEGSSEINLCIDEQKVVAFEAQASDAIWVTGNGQMSHWDGADWQLVPTPVFLQPKWRGELETNELFDLSFLSAEKGWAVGGMTGFSGESRASSQETWQRLLFEWDGKDWKYITPVGINMMYLPLKAIVMLSATEGWMAGSANELYHWDGKRWNEYLDKNGNKLEAIEFESIAAIDSKHIWLAGWDASYDVENPGFMVVQGVIFFWNGKEWQEQYRSQKDNSAILSINLLDMNDGWAVGGSHDPYVDENILLHWDGVTWREEAIYFHKPLKSVCVSDKGIWIFSEAAVLHKEIWRTVESTDTPVITPIPKTPMLNGQNETAIPGSIPIERAGNNNSLLCGSIVTLLIVIIPTVIRCVAGRVRSIS